MKRLYNQPIKADAVFQCGIALIFVFGYKTKLLFKLGLGREILKH
jgi:hypothetical protein